MTSGRPRLKVWVRGEPVGLLSLERPFHHVYGYSTGVP